MSGVNPAWRGGRPLITYAPFMEQFWGSFAGKGGSRHFYVSEGGGKIGAPRSVCALCASFWGRLRVCASFLPPSLKRHLCQDRCNASTQPLSSFLHFWTMLSTCLIFCACPYWKNDLHSSFFPARAWLGAIENMHGWKDGYWRRRGRLEVEGKKTVRSE